jgi:hypothetical protein
MVQTRGQPDNGDPPPPITVTTSTSTSTKRKKKKRGGDGGVQYVRDRTVEQVFQPASVPNHDERPPALLPYASARPPDIQELRPKSASSMSSRSTAFNQGPSPVVLTSIAQPMDLNAVFIRTQQPSTSTTYSQPTSVVAPASTAASFHPLTPNVQARETLDMSMERPSEVGMRQIVKNCVKTAIFKMVKFLDRDTHGFFDVSDKSVCGRLLQLCFHEDLAVYAKEARDWWILVRPWVFNTHMHARNNAIKSMKIAYTGKSTTSLLLSHVCI